MACPRLCRTEVMNYFAFLAKQLNKNLFDLVKSLKLPFDQLIWEKGDVWVHVSCGPRNRRQVLSICK
jgi:hypothetical protein